MAAAARKQSLALDRVGKQKLLTSFHAHERHCDTSATESSAYGSSSQVFHCSSFDVQSEPLEKVNAQDEQEPESLGGGRLAPLYH